MTKAYVKLSKAKARNFIFSALTGAGASAINVCYFTEAILDTELSGLEGHGFYWLQYYCAHVKSGKVGDQLAVEPLGLEAGFVVVELLFRNEPVGFRRSRTRKGNELGRVEAAGVVAD